MNKIRFSPAVQHGLKIYSATNSSKYSIIEDSSTKKFYIRIISSEDCRDWEYPQWGSQGFNSITAAEEFLNDRDWKSATSEKIEKLHSTDDNFREDFKDAMRVLGFMHSEVSGEFLDDAEVYSFRSQGDPKLDIRITYNDDTHEMQTFAWINEARIPLNKLPRPTTDLSRMIRNTERLISRYVEDCDVFCSATLIDISERKDVITAGISTRDMLRNIVKVKSSNVWGYALNIKNRKDRFGDLIVQFKGKNGGPDDVYLYYDVPVNLYRRWQSAPSKGHFFWQYIRNNFQYRKLTGNKRGVLPNAIN